MNRRKFLKQALTFSPLVAAPSLAVATMAHVKSDIVEQKFEKFVLHGDNVTIADCQFSINGSIVIQGQYATVASNSITMNHIDSEIPVFTIKGS
jgi:hypothetical protein